MATSSAGNPFVTAPAGGVQGRQPDQLSLSRLIVLGLTPGALATLVYVLLSGPIEAAGYPPALGLLLAILLVIIPVELGVVLRASRSESTGQGALASVPYRVPMSGRDWALLVPLLLVAGIVGFGLVGAIEAPIRDGPFGWLPAWFRDPLPVDSVDRYAPSAWMITLILYFVLNVMAGPIVEELYFRGYLLPRMSRYGRWAPLLNVMLFSLYHFWSPWQFLSRVAGVTPYVYGVWWKRNVYLGMVVHISLNAIGTATIAILVLQRLE